MNAAIAIAVFAAAYILIASEKVNRVTAALGGAGVLLALRIVHIDDIFFSDKTGIAWDVIFLLLGMMIIVGILQRTGVFEYMAIWAAKRARGRPYRVMALLAVIAAVASAGLDNVTTVILLVPVTLLVCDRLGVRPVPFLIVEALASNIGGTATLVGDPPNIIAASAGGLSFNSFLVNLAPIIVVLMAVFIGMCRLMFPDVFRYDPERAVEIMALNEREAIKDRTLLIRGLAVLGAVVVAFVLHPVLHVEPTAVALLGAGLLILVARVPAREYLQEVEWDSLAFFMGLFIMVGALVKVGLIGQLAQYLGNATEGRLLLATMIITPGSALISGVVDNIPYVAAAAPVVHQLVVNASGSGGSHVLWWALLLGADLGGNLTAIGASANVVTVGLAKRNGYDISFWQFTKYGSMVVGVTVPLSMLYLYLRYFLLG